MSEQLRVRILRITQHYADPNRWIADIDDAPDVVDSRGPEKQFTVRPSALRLSVDRGGKVRYLSICGPLVLKSGKLSSTTERVWPRDGFLSEFSQHPQWLRDAAELVADQIRQGTQDR